MNLVKKQRLSMFRKNIFLYKLLSLPASKDVITEKRRQTIEKKLESV